MPLALSVTGCAALPGFEDPSTFGAARYGALQLRGDTTLQSTPGVVAGNSSIRASDLGFGDTNDEIGVTLGIGDGFSGIELDVLRVDDEPSDEGTLPGPFGAMQTGDITSSELELNEVRLSYRACLFGTEFDVRDQPLEVMLGLGGTLIYRDFQLDTFDGNGSGRRARIETNSGIVYQPSVRVGATWNNIGVLVDYGYADGLNTGGDWDGVHQDIRIEASYEFPTEAVQIFGTWRRSEFEASGVSGGLNYQNDLILDGFEFGARFAF